MDGFGDDPIGRALAWFAFATLCLGATIVGGCVLLILRGLW